MHGDEAGAELAHLPLLRRSGNGFAFIEIALMQKLGLCLGQPICAITVVLTTLLAFALLAEARAQ